MLVVRVLMRDREIDLVLGFMEREREIERGRLGFKGLERDIQH